MGINTKVYNGKHNLCSHMGALFLQGFLMVPHLHVTPQTIPAVLQGHFHCLQVDLQLQLMSGGTSLLSEHEHCYIEETVLTAAGYVYRVVAP